MSNESKFINIQVDPCELAEPEEKPMGLMSRRDTND